MAPLTEHRTDQCAARAHSLRRHRHNLPYRAVMPASIPAPSAPAAFLLPRHSVHRSPAYFFLQPAPCRTIHSPALIITSPACAPPIPFLSFLHHPSPSFPVLQLPTCSLHSSLLLSSSPALPSPALPNHCPSRHLPRHHESEQHAHYLA